MPNLADTIPMHRPSWPVLACGATTVAHDWDYLLGTFTCNGCGWELPERDAPALRFWWDHIAYVTQAAGRPFDN